ncbi:hemolysin family protein, partial [Actinosynnema sp. NPDC023658]|uniref:hemolysin family protein n=1 Tax=Actinosynnema sp. NPDC023658 TaxID=3155465 RepID=UPI0033E55398
MIVLVILLLLAGNAFFVGAEFSIITARRDRLEALAEQGSSRARTAIKAGRELPLLIAGAQLGITLCSLGLGALGEPAVSALLEAPFHGIGVPDAVRHGVAFALALIIVVALHTVLGEMVPKNLAIAGPERTALLLVPAHYWFCRLVAPLLRGFTVASTAVLKLMGVTPKDELESAYTRDELALLIGQSRQEGLLEDSEHRRLAQTLSSAERTVSDVLVPLDRITSVPVRPTMQEVEAAVSATGFSRFPVREDDRLIGYLHVKDVLDLADADPSTRVPPGRVRGLPRVRVDASLDDAVAALRRSQS